jgi:predicted ATPase
MSDPPSLPVSSGIFAFLFSDIEGSTQRWERDPDAMAAALRRHDQIVRAAMERHRGHVFKTMGDAFCVAFPTPLDAVGAALEAQRGLATEDFATVDGVRVRMGIHVGAAEIRGDDYFGQPLNRVARLMATSHGGQIVVSGAVAAQLRDQLPGEVSLHDLGEHRLKDLVEPEHAWQVMAPGLPAHFPPLKSAGHYQHNLPDYLATFVGREKESRELGQMIGRNRLVTMLGAGGLGKTRLSVRVGLEQLGSFPDGVWFVELAPLGDPQLVAETVAGTVSVTVPRERSATDALVAALRARKLLLILDNCEHLVGAAAALAHTLIGACPTVSILASSREALGVPGEKLFRVPPLAWPHKPAGMSAAEALHYPAVRLFAERAAASLGRFELADDQVPAVVGICKRLDGIALAIELAAPRLKMLKPEALLARLDDRFRLLTGGSRTVLPRQQTLRALIDWSHDLLSPAERMLMRRLAVFAGDWTLDGAAAVTVGDGIDEWEMFDLLTSLVDKSLVVTVMSDSTTRYNFLESTRAYAAEKLAEAGEGHWRRRLAEYLAGLLKEAETRYETTATIEWRGSYGPEIDNVRAALDWAFGPEGDVPLGLEVTAYSSWLWSELDLAAEERRRLEVATPLIDAATPPAVAARIYYMRTAVRAMGLSSAQSDARRAVELARQAKDQVAIGRGLLHLARTLVAPATLTDAGSVLDEVLPIARARLCGRNP